MLNKKWFAGLIFILLILTVSAVNAEDSLSADISDSNEQILITDESDENLLISDEDNEKLPTDNEYSAKILNDADIGSFDDLASEIEKIEDGGVLNLSKDYKYASGSSDGILLNKSITINGNNHTIDGNGQSRIFNISKNNITLNDLILVNGNHDIGGAIFSFKPIVCNNLIFENNHATNAGAIYTSNGLKLYNCIFDGNAAKDGAAIFIDTNYAEDDDETFPDEEYPYEETSPNEETNPNDEYTNDEYSDEEYPDEEYPDDEDYDPFPFLIENSIFKNNHNTSRGLIFSQTLETVKIINATFANSTAEYGAAIFGEKGSEFYIYNSSFTDLHASISGGALLLVSFSKGIIENCSFINTSAKSNGGSICNSVFCTGIYETTTPLEINNCEFKNSESGYGGVISQAGGLFNISNSLFEGNNAIHSGGAIYAAFCGLNISNSTFNDNKLNYTDFESNGGAINVFYGNISVDSSKFNDNTKNAIYFVEGGYEIKNSLFNNNEEAIHSAYEEYGILENNNYTKDRLSLNNSDDDIYRVIINNTGAEIKLINNTIDVTTLPRFFDLREWGWVSAVKDQEDSGACWIFATCAALESSLLKATGVEYNLSINNLQKNLLTFSKYGSVNVTEGGQAPYAAAYSLAWYGPLPVEYEEFDKYGKISMPIFSNDTIHVQDILWISERNINDTVYTPLKEAIIKYGGVVCGMLMQEYAEPFYNNKTAAYYYYNPMNNNTQEVPEGDNATPEGDNATPEGDNATPEGDNANPEEEEIPDVQEDFTNHAICVVGWDDNYPASNFLKTPPGNGAWIIKNSYGSQNFDNGFIYLSYYDEAFARDDDIIAYIFENTENYTKNYQTDISGRILFENKTSNYSYKNSYQSIDDDFISAVGTYFNGTGEEYALEIYVNGELKHNQNGTAPYRGFHTIKLTENIAIKKGDNFTAVMKASTAPIITDSFRHYKANSSFVDRGNGWEDLSKENTTASLKVYTVSENKDKPSRLIATKIECKNMTTTAVAKADGRVGKYFYVTLKDENGTVLANKAIKIGFNGAVYNRTTDENGCAKLQINLGYKGLYTFAIGFLGDDDYLGAFEVAKITVNVQKAKLTAPNKSYKATAKTKSLTANFKTVHGKGISGKKISFTVNGKTYTASTNSKGVATVKVSLNKKGTYNFTVKFAGDNTFAAANIKAKLTLK